MKYAAMDEIFNKLFERESYLASELTIELESVLGILVEYCESCHSWRVDTEWHESGDEFVCHSCYECAIDMAHDMRDEYDYQDGE